MTGRWRGNAFIVILLFVSILWVNGCSSNSSSKDVPVPPFPTQDISGVWIGAITDSDATDVTNAQAAVGIITADGDAMFVGQNAFDQFMQFITRAGSPLSVTARTAVFQGALDLCRWNTNGVDYGDYSLQTGSVFGAASTKDMLGTFPGAAYTFTGNSANPKTFVFFYNTTYDVTPDVRNIQGTWKITPAWQHANLPNTLTLTITTTNPVSTTTADVDGTDTYGNTFNGTITIHVSAPPKNVYDVSLKLNNDDTKLLEGLATYVSALDTQGISLPDTLVIGAANASKTFSLSGLATKQ
jgi:hypothetical protein